MMARVTTVTADGLELEGWWQPPAAGRPTVLYFHGNGGNVGGRDDKARRMIERGYGVLLAGYRGYGGNPGSPSEAGLIDDGRAWLDRVVPIDHGEALFEVAPEPKRLVRLQGGAHTDLFDHGALEALDAFVTEVIAAGRWPAAAL
jgi:fermentation-respiration switch protein FrsA (DUF1100 family)